MRKPNQVYPIAVAITFFSNQLTAFAAPPVIDAPTTAQVTEAKGDIYKRGFVDWNRDVWGEPTNARVGDRLEEGMQLGTGENSWAQLKWKNITTRAWEKSVYAIAPNQRLVYLLGGEMLFQLDKHRKDKQEYYVWTNLLQARIRGTTVMVQSTGTNSKISVLEGSIDVMNRVDHSVVHLKPGVVMEIQSKSALGPLSATNGVEAVMGKSYASGVNAVNRAVASTTGNASQSTNSNNSSTGTTNTTNTSGSAASEVSHAASGVVNGVTGTVDTALNGATGVVGHTLNGVTGTVEKTLNGVTGTVGKTLTGVTGAVGQTVNGLTDTVDGTLNGVSGTVGTTVNGVTGTVGTSLKGVSGTVGDTLGGVLVKGSALSNVSAPLDTTITGLSGTTAKTLSTVSGTVDKALANVSGTVGSTANGVTGTLGNTLTGVAGTLGNTLNGATGLAEKTPSLISLPDGATGKITTTMISNGDTRISVFETAKTITTLYSADPKNLMNSPLVTGFPSALPSLGLIQTALTDPAASKPIASNAQILKVPTMMSYNIGSLVGSTLPLPDGVLNWPPTAVIGTTVNKVASTGNVLVSNLKSIAPSLTGNKYNPENPTTQLPVLDAVLGPQLPGGIAPVSQTVIAANQILSNPLAVAEIAANPLLKTTLVSGLLGGTSPLLTALTNPATSVSPTVPGINVGGVTLPGVGVGGATLPGISLPPLLGVLPPVSLPPVAVGPITLPPIALPPIGLPPITLPPISGGPITVPPIGLPPITVPPITLPPIAVPPITVPPIAVPPITVPPVALPPITVPPITVPPITVPPIAVPPISAGPISTPPVALPPLQLPPIQLPGLGLGGLLGGRNGR